MKRSIVSACLYLCCMIAISESRLLASPDSQPTPIHVLILSGQNNHNWEKTTPALAEMLLDAGGFVVTVVNHPEHLLSVGLQNVDVILSNWNTYGGSGDEKVADWSQELKRAYVAFVKNGGGHVMVHAGSSSFPEWSEYQQISLATWKNGMTGHGAPHEFEVTLTDAGKTHPITRGMSVSRFHIHDELWHRSASTSNATAIVQAFASSDKGGTGQLEPLAFVGKYGKGNCFALMLGHAAATEGQSMLSPYFKELLVRGIRWTTPNASQ